MSIRCNIGTISLLSDPDTYSTWGGLVEEYDDTVLVAAARELKEELDLIVEPNDFIFLNVEEIDARSPSHAGQKVLMCYFAVEVLAGTALKLAEGQAIIYRSLPLNDKTKLNAISERAIALYEALRA